jgi:hypothetical protein
VDICSGGFNCSGYSCIDFKLAKLEGGNEEPD